MKGVRPNHKIGEHISLPNRYSPRMNRTPVKNKTKQQQQAQKQASKQTKHSRVQQKGLQSMNHP